MPRKQSRPLLCSQQGYSGQRVEQTHRDRIDLASAVLVSVTMRTFKMKLTLSLRRTIRLVTLLSPNPYAGPKLPLVWPAEMKQMIEIQHFSRWPHIQTHQPRYTVRQSEK